MRDCTPYAVVHSAVESLAETGFLLDQGRIGPEEAFASYVRVRGRTLEHCRTSGGGLVDLDCKLSPLAPVLLQHFPSLRFAVVLREPLSFVASGMARGYFRDHHPQALGHLVGPGPGAQVDAVPDIDPMSQAMAIAHFWNRIACIAQGVHAGAEDRVVLLDMPSLFRSRTAVRERLEPLGLRVDSARLDAYGSFEQRKNANRAAPLQPFDIEAVAPALRQLAFEGLSTRFLEGCGLA